MKKAQIGILFFIIIFLSLGPALAYEESYTPPVLDVEVPGSVTPNTDVSVRITVENATGTRMWRSKVYLDLNSMPSTIKQYLQFYETEEYLTKQREAAGEKDAMEPGEVITTTFRIKVGKETPALTIPIYVVLETEIGECEEGCAPYFRTFNAEIVVIRNDPNLFLVLDVDDVVLEVGDCDIAKGSFAISYVIQNSSQSTAFNVNVYVPTPPVPLSINITPQMPLTSLKPGEEKNGIFYATTGNLSPGANIIPINLTYADYYGKQFSTSASFTLSVVGNAYELYSQANLDLDSCEYESAAEGFTSAMDIYLDVGNVEMVNRCEEMLAYIMAVNYFSTAQDNFYSGDIDAARGNYQIAKGHYMEANDCTGVALCEKGIDACNDANQGSGDSSTNDGGISALDIALIIVIMALLGILVMSRKR
ncbi:MAG: COG1361 family protein [Candidatus Methanofastidiosia archaeon]